MVREALALLREDLRYANSPPNALIYQLDKYSPVLQIDLHSESSWEIKAIKGRRNGICKDELSYLGIFMSTAEDASQQTGRQKE